jgi:hypothetical protein
MDILGCGHFALEGRSGGVGTGLWKLKRGAPRSLCQPANVHTSFPSAAAEGSGDPLCAANLQLCRFRSAQNRVHAM